MHLPNLREEIPSGCGTTKALVKHVLEASVRILIPRIEIVSLSYEIVFIWMTQDFADDKWA